MSPQKVSNPQGCIPYGSVLCDCNAKKWKLGSYINTTGSTESYEAAPHHENTAASGYPTIIKIEPRANRLLSSDMQFYIDNADSKEIDDWIETKNVQKYGLGMPRLLGVGSHEYNAKCYYFITLERHGIDVRQLFVENNRKLPVDTVYKIAFKTIRVLEYIHSRGYVHGDVKGANILMDLKKKHRVYLTNFALTKKCPDLNSEINPEKAHYGDVQYSSRDHHMGVPTMRGDLEMLLYNMIQWLCGNLPWKNSLDNPCVVQQFKENAFKNTTIFLQECFETSEVPATINEFMTLLASMNRLDKPEYEKFLSILKNGVQEYRSINKEANLDAPPIASTSERHVGDALTSDNMNILSSQDKLNNQLGARRSLRLKEKDQTSTNFTAIKRKIKDDEPRIVKRRKRKTKLIDEVIENEPNKSDASNNNPTREDSSSQNQRCGNNYLNSSKLAVPPLIPIPGCQYAPPTPLQSQQWPDTYEDLNFWLEMKDKNLEALGPISSEPQMMTSELRKLRVVREEFHMQQRKIDYLIEVLSKLPIDSVGAQKIDEIVQRWRIQFSRLEEHGQKLSDAYFDQLDRILQRISNELNNVPVNKNTEEILAKLNVYAGRLENHQTLFANAKFIKEQLSQIFSGSTLKSRVQTKFLSVNKLYLDLQQKIDARKVEIEKSLKDFYDTCEEIVTWLKKELDDMPENVLVSADRETLLQQLQHHEAIHQRISSKEVEIKDLFKESNNVTSLLNDNRLWKCHIDFIQSQWTILKRRGLKMLQKLQTCLENCKKFDNAQNQFLPWLNVAEAWLESSKSASLESKEDILKLLKQLSSFNEKMVERSCEYRQNIELGNTFINSCDKDKESIINNKLTTMEERWLELNNSILERKQLIEDTDSFTKSLCDLKRELEQCEVRYTDYDIMEKATKESKVALSLIKELRAKTDCLQGPLNDLRQKKSILVLQTKKQGIDIDHLAEMDRVYEGITNLKAKLAENRIEILQILEQKAVEANRKQEEKIQLGRNMNVNRQRVIKSEKVLLIDLVNDEN